VKIIIAVCALSLTVLLGQASAQDRSSVGPEITTSFDVDAATQAYLAQIPPDKRSSSDRYFEGGYWLYFGNILYTTALMLLFLLSGLSTRLRDFVGRLTVSRNLQAAVYFALLLLATAVLRIPLAFYGDFIREHQYGSRPKQASPGSANTSSAGLC